MGTRERRTQASGTNRVYRRAGSPYWQAEWYDERGERHQRSTRTADRVAALSRLRAWERSPGGEGPVDAPKTVRGAIEDLVALRAEEAVAGRKAEATAGFLALKGGQVCRVFGEDAPLSDVTAESVDRFIAQRRREGRKDSTIHKELVCLRSACALALRRGHWQGDLAKVFPRGFSPAYTPKDRWLTSAECERLIEDLVGHTADRAAVVAFIVATSAEWSAVGRARAEDCDLTPGAERVRVRGSKRKTRDREVPLVFPWQRDLVKFALERARGTKDGLLFRRWGNVRRELHAACDRLGIKPCTPNDLRRTAGHWTRGEGAQPATVGAFLGHKDGRMAERVYAKLGVDELAAALTRESRGPLPSVTKVSGAGAISARLTHPAHSLSVAKQPVNAVPRDGVEPPTRGFSVLSSVVTIRLPDSGFGVVGQGTVTKVSGRRVASRPGRGL